ncbi:MAG: hypothetical protein SVM79_05870, partial [Chloroflexota bacterium]|nr:hypothetical protein [Chloroflexota bacterium]
EMCAREKTAFWVDQQVEKARKVLAQLGLGAERLQSFVSSTIEEDPSASLDRFTEQIGGLYLYKLLKEEVKS